MATKATGLDCCSTPKGVHLQGGDQQGMGLAGPTWGLCLLDRQSGLPDCPRHCLSALPAPDRYTVAVRALCEFTAKQGDLDLRFTPSATALEGVAGHLLAASRRGPDYEAEVTLAGGFEALWVRGRADGYDPHAQRLDEVKTYRGDLSLMPENRRHLHWAQAKVYGALLCRERGLAQLDVALVYVDVGTQSETVFTERHSAAALQAFFEAQCQRFLAWARQELAHRAARNTALAALQFPHAEFRLGQRALSEAVYKATTSGRTLLAQAPTGIGKTVGTLFPMLKAWPAQGLDKLCFLTAKTPGRALALEALHTIARSAPQQPLPLRVLELVARDKACEHPDKACHGESCPLARGFYDRLPAARSAALATLTLGKASLRQVALQHEVCPYHLGQELVRWADVVVGDYNHYFDSSALIHGLTLTDGWKLGVLIDEAHNLVERARKMYSAELRHSQLRAVWASAPAALKPSLGRIDRQWDNWSVLQTAAYTVHAELPQGLVNALQGFIAAMSDHLVDRPDTDASLLRFYFDALHFIRLNDSLGDHSLIDLSCEAADELTAATTITSGPADSVLCIRNVVPAPFLRPRFALAHSSTLFSATLQPTRYYLDLLGLPDDTVAIDVPSPFSAGQLTLRLAANVSTRWAERSASVAPIADLIAQQYRQLPGNYLAFFSSFDYLQRVADHLASEHPGVPMWQQSRQMDEAARDDFLARFQPHSAGVGFAVLGGAFAEGIDLPGRRLIGAFVATLGLPQFNPVNEQIRRRMDHCFGEDQGHDYTYLYPGLQKVVQAAGRVIRTPEDQGVIWLIDRRYQRPSVRRLLPAWWPRPAQ